MSAAAYGATHNALLLADGGLTALARFWRRVQSGAPLGGPWRLVWIAPQPPAGDAAALDDASPDQLRLSTAWKHAAWGLTSGFQHLTLWPDRLELTLCVGPTLPLLREQRFLADTLWVDSAFVARLTQTETASPWIAKAMAACSGENAVLHWLDDTPSDALLSPWQTLMRGVGFLPDPEHPLTWRHHPFASRRTKIDLTPPVPRPGHCAVVGAGLAGAAVAAALAHRGWQVTVIDCAEQPASAASGLPAGLVVPHISRDDCPLSRLSRIGVRMMLHQASQLLRHGVDWALSGVLERRIGATPALPRHDEVGLADWFEEAGPELSALWGEGVWHHRGAWIRPSALVHAWLKTSGVSFFGGLRVKGLVRNANGIWQLQDGSGHTVLSAERVVLANAANAWPLAQSAQGVHPAEQRVSLPPMQVMRGLLSHAPLQHTPAARWPEFPVNGAGSLIPGVTVQGEPSWLMGSTYQPACDCERSDVENHGLNHARLRALLPDLAEALQPCFAGPMVRAWKNQRCIPRNRLPVIGPAHASNDLGLWLCAGMGSRGLSFSVLCAQWLAARWMGEPWPVPGSMGRQLDSRRAA
ncbi:MAG: bifunctional tRNA (5-methylaminomethyl-2-thiouridine)(34)-methyltransferase MnmD/FAD-dependent 5-carboxymethylaminomethyl-2-thiouridine(34) oxidoreductase MnmC [Rhodoferax sp.]